MEQMKFSDNVEFGRIQRRIRRLDIVIKVIRISVDSRTEQGMSLDIQERYWKLEIVKDG